MSAFYPGTITVIHDPGDDVEITRAALAAHDPGRGQITVHPTVGSASPVTLAFDILSALGTRITDKTASDQQIGTANRAYAATAAWLSIERIEVVIVLRAHLLSAGARQWLGRLASAARLRVVAIWHGRRREDWAAAFRHHQVGEHDEIEAVLAGARVRPAVRAPIHGGELPELSALPVSGLAHFRADARRLLPAAPFAALDAHYRLGLHEACRWIAGHREGQTRTAALARERAEASAARQGCLGHALGRERGTPRRFADVAGLHTFLSDLVGDSPAPAATIARVRGAQAGLLLHGIALQVPVELASCRGPGLTGPAVTDQVAAAIRREAANPLIATALALSAITGLSAEEVLEKPRPEPRPHGHDVAMSVGWQYENFAHYTIPAPARPILSAAGLFLRQICRPTSNLLAGVTAVQVRQVAHAAGIEVPDKPADPAHPIWHARARAWHVADALHHPHTRQQVVAL